MSRPRRQPPKSLFRRLRAVRADDRNFADALRGLLMPDRGPVEKLLRILEGAEAAAAHAERDEAIERGEEYAAAVRASARLLRHEVGTSDELARVALIAAEIRDWQWRLFADAIFARALRGQEKAAGNLRHLSPLSTREIHEAISRHRFLVDAAAELGLTERQLRRRVPAEVRRALRRRPRD